MDTNLYIFGNGEVAEMLKYYFDHDSQYKVGAFVVDDEYCQDANFLELPLISWSEFLSMTQKSNLNLHVALSYKNMNAKRHEVYKRAKETKGVSLCSYVSSKIYLARDVSMGANVCILENQVIQNRVEIGNNVMLWSGNHIGHGSRIGESTYLSSHVVVSGHTTIGKRCFFGVNSATRDFVKIGDDCFIAMSASVLRDIPNSSSVMPFQSPIIEGEKAIRIMRKATGGESRE